MKIENCWKLNKNGRKHITIDQEFAKYLQNVLKSGVKERAKISHFLRCIITEFDRKVDFQNHLFGWIRLENWFF